MQAWTWMSSMDVQQTVMAVMRRYGSPPRARPPVGLKLLAWSSMPAQTSTSSVNMVAQRCKWQLRGGLWTLFNF